MLGSQSLLPNRQRPPVKRLGLGVLALVVVQLRQAVEAGSHLGMLRPPDFLIDRQGAPVEWLGVGVIALCVVELGQVVEAGGDVLVVRSRVSSVIVSACG